MYRFKEITLMETTQKLGILIFTGVPAIMGGGIVFALFGTLLPVIIFEVLLYLAVVGFCLKN